MNCYFCKKKLIYGAPAPRILFCSGHYRTVYHHGNVSRTMHEVSFNIRRGTDEYGFYLYPYDAKTYMYIIKWDSTYKKERCQLYCGPILPLANPSEKDPEILLDKILNMKAFL